VSGWHSAVHTLLRGSYFICCAHDVQVSGVPSHVLHVGLHCTHSSPTYTLSKGVQLDKHSLKKKKGFVPFLSQVEQVVIVLLQVSQGVAHFWHLFAARSSM
jgi:hypothetical protein